MKETETEKNSHKILLVINDEILFSKHEIFLEE